MILACNKYILGKLLLTMYVIIFHMYTATYCYYTLQLIMSSDKLGSIQQPVVSVDFDLCEGGESKRENVELSKDELEQLIMSLEAANKVIIVKLSIVILYSGKVSRGPIFKIFTVDC